MTLASMEHREWLETDGLGGFASGTESLLRTRRYHALLLLAEKPPTDRVVLVSGIEAWVETEQGRSWISSQRYEDGVIHPDGADRIDGFHLDPWPRWAFDVAGLGRLDFEIFLPYRTGSCVLMWRQGERSAGSTTPKTFAPRASSSSICQRAKPFSP